MEQLAAAMAQLASSQQLIQEQQQLQREAMEQQIQQLTQQCELQKIFRELNKRAAVKNKRVKMAEYKDGEDINSFLEAFEGIMKLNEVEENDWLKFLVPSLTGKARKVSQYLDYSECTYDEVNEG